MMDLNLTNNNFYLKEKIIFFDDYFGIKLETPNKEFVYDYFDYEFNELYLYDNPNYLNNAFNFEINNFAYDLINNKININLKFEYNHHEIISTMGFIYVDNLVSDLFVKIYLNDSLIFDDQIGLFNKYKEEKDINISIPIEYLNFEEEIKIKVISYSSNNYFEINNYIFNNYWDYKKYFNLSDESVSFFYPYYFSDEKILYEKFDFIRIFNKNYKYPSYIKPLFLFKYETNFNNLSYSIEYNSNIKLLHGLNNDQENLIIDYVLFNDYYLFFINDFFYYDYNLDKTVKGKNENFNYFNSFVIPWDYYNNYGEIYFDLTFSSLLNYEFKISIPFFIKDNLDKKISLIEEILNDDYILEYEYEYEIQI